MCFLVQTIIGFGTAELLNDILARTAPATESRLAALVDEIERTCLMKGRMNERRNLQQSDH
jgi:hypothetical protein